MSDRDEALDAIREAHAAGMRPSVVQRKLAAGTLDGLSRPIEMSSRSFFRRWTQARNEQAGGARQQPQAGESVLAALGRKIAEREEKPRRLVEAGLAEGKAPGLILEEIVDSMRLTPEQANELLPPELRLDHETRDLKRLRESPHMRAWHDQLHRGKQMAAAGASLEEMAEAANMSTHNAGMYFGTALAERESAAAAAPRMENG